MGRIRPIASGNREALRVRRPLGVRIASATDAGRHASRSGHARREPESARFVAGPMKAHEAQEAHEAHEAHAGPCRPMQAHGAHKAHRFR